ncbi:MAG: antitoxin [Patulibacter sp.]|nr:antitoxin [Patulibacter sp.]
MPRTTLDIDATVLRELKRRQQREGKSLGRLASELLAVSLASDAPADTPSPLTWTSRSMGARVDLDDKDALNAALDAR